MGEWEEKLGAILGDPAAMGKIMELARSLETGGEAPPEAPPPPPEPPAGLDPALMEAGIRALAAWNDGADRRAALLDALKPFIKPERHARLDQAMRIARLSRVARQALGQKGGAEGV